MSISLIIQLSQGKSLQHTKKKGARKKKTLGSINNTTDSFGKFPQFMLAIFHAQHAIIPRTAGSLLLPSNHSLKIRFAYCMN